MYKTIYLSYTKDPKINETMQKLIEDIEILFVKHNDKSVILIGTIEYAYNNFKNNLTLLTLQYGVQGA